MNIWNFLLTVVKHDAAVAKVADDPKLSEADDELGEEDKHAFDEVQCIINLKASIKINVWIYEIFYLQLSNMKLLP